MRDARDVAADALTAFRRRGAWSDNYLKNEITKSLLSERDAALATAITNGVLENMLYIDYYISNFSSVKFNKISPGILDVLRIAVYQILFLERVPDSAAVNDAVRRAKRGNARAASFVNAVLRNISSNKNALPEIAGDYASVLSIKYSHPLWLVRMLINIYGEDVAREIISANNENADTYARVNTLKTTREKLIKALEADNISAKPGKIENSIVLKSYGNLQRLQSFCNGDFYIQDAASQVAAEALGAEPGMEILDACAAPGGKSFLLAGAMKNTGKLVSCDIYEHKLELISNGAARLGISNIETRLCDASKFIREFESRFDAVLADVPCSGLGIIRKKPDIRYKDENSISALPELQLRILRNTSRYVKPGGSLVYSTCTIIPRENFEVIDRFLSETELFEECSIDTIFPCLKNSFGYTLLTPISGTDGFYICKLRRKR